MLLSPSSFIAIHTLLSMLVGGCELHELKGRPTPNYEGLQFYTYRIKFLCPLLSCTCGIRTVWSNWHTGTFWWGLKPDETFPRDRSELGANSTKGEQSQSRSANDPEVFPWNLVFFSQAEG